MKIFLIPIECTNHPRADVRLAPIMSVLSKKGDIIGLEFVREITFESSHDLFTKRKIIGYSKLILYLLKTFMFGLKNLRQIDIIFCEHLYSALVGSALSILSRKPCIWDSHGNLLEACREFNNSRFYTALTLLLEKMINKIPKVIVVPTELDRQLYIRQGFDPNKLAVIASGVDFSPLKQITENKNKIREKLGLDLDKKILLLSGNRDHQANKEAAFWVNEKLAPVLSKKLNNVQILITGKGEVPLEINPVVSFVGFVPNIYEYIIASDLCLAPVILGNGVPTKLLDYLACGRPAIVLPSLVKGMPLLVQSKSIIIAKDKDEFITKTIDTLNNLSLAEEIGLNAKKVIEKHYNWDVLQVEWGKLVDKTLGNVS
jgi:glycosyltransferase involved in cell wall biosynthesis